MHEFQEFIHIAGLRDAGFVGNPYTWCNNRQGAARIWQWLDRAMLSINFQDNFPYIKNFHLAPVGSDHTPLCIMEMVANAWSRQFTGTPGNLFAKKLKHLKRVLKEELELLWKS